MADYDSLNVRQISERLDGLNAEEIERLRGYEARNKDRRISSTVLIRGSRPLPSRRCASVFTGI